MSTADPVVSTVNDITSQIVTYTPAVAAAVQAAEMTGASGQSKKQAVLNAIQAGSQLAAGVPQPQVAAISSLVNLVVSIFNALGVFSHKPGN